MEENSSHLWRPHYVLQKPFPHYPLLTVPHRRGSERQEGGAWSWQCSPHCSLLSFKPLVNPLYCPFLLLPLEFPYLALPIHLSAYNTLLWVFWITSWLLLHIPHAFSPISHSQWDPSRALIPLTGTVSTVLVFWIVFPYSPLKSFYSSCQLLMHTH